MLNLLVQHVTSRLKRLNTDQDANRVRVSELQWRGFNKCSGMDFRKWELDSWNTSSHSVEEDSEVHPAHTIGTSEPEELWSQGGPWEGNMTIAVSSSFAKHVFVVLLSTLDNFSIRRQMITQVFVIRKGEWSSFMKINYFF